MWRRHATTKVPEGLRLLKMLRLLRVVRTTRILERYQETLMRVYKLVTIGRLLALLVLLSHWMRVCARRDVQFSAKTRRC